MGKRRLRYTLLAWRPDLRSAHQGALLTSEDSFLQTCLPRFFSREICSLVEAFVAEHLIDSDGLECEALMPPAPWLYNPRQRKCALLVQALQDEAALPRDEGGRAARRQRRSRKRLLSGLHLEI